MGDVTQSLEEAAESIFSNLGYAVSADENGIRAERKWRVVDVTPMAEPRGIPTAGEFRCFVTWAEQVQALEDRIERSSPGYEWAIIGVEEDEDYVVSRQ